MLKVCPLCHAEALKTFRFWKIVNNNFPYDAIAKIHHMIVPLRHTKERGLNAEELDELLQIKEEVLNSEYDYLIEAALKNRSIPEHFHLHLVISK